MTAEKHEQNENPAEDIVHFKKSEEVYPLAQELFEEQKERILSLFPYAKVEHVGSGAVPGALTRGDLDIQVRVSQDDFKTVCKGLAGMYHENHPDLWTDEFALFHRKDHPKMPISIVVTVVDSRYDDFHTIRDLLKSSTEALKEYNNFKLRYEGKSQEEYGKAKTEFLGPNGEPKFVKRYGK